MEGENPFRMRTYRNAAHSVSRSRSDTATVWRPQTAIW
ncbi:hypothetical protein [Paraburkholderia sp. WS6]